jgi:membrane protein implicated in regulation of membrane protease activity
METVFLGIFIFGGLFTVLSAALGAVSTFDHGFPHGHGHGHHGDTWLSGSALTAFLTCFGAAGYLLSKTSDWALPGVVVGALAGGTLGGLLIARYLRLILKGERVMNPDDYRLAGTIGHITVPIPANGTGEVVFSKAGARRSEAARALDATPIPRGTEVVIADYKNGIAAVQPWADFMADEHTAAQNQAESKVESTEA